MKKRLEYPLVVIGAGSGGLVIAIGAARAGKRVLLIEKDNYGGDCTNFGCIPSKSLIASAHAAHLLKTAGSYGLSYALSDFEASGALERTRNIVQEIREEEEPEALESLGVDTLTGTASFLDPHTLLVGDTEVKARQMVIAAGSSPRIPEIPGLDSVPYLTNETVFDLTEIPKKLAVIGGGPIGCELAQTFRRLGSEVAVIQLHERLLEKEEPEASQLLEEVFEAEGIAVYRGRKTVEIKPAGGGVRLKLDNGETLEGSHLLVAVGRKPNLAALDLEKAGVKSNARGIPVDAYGRSSQKHIWAVGDITGEALFTHAAENRARTVLTNLLLPWPLRFRLDRRQPMPRVTYTDPEIAAVGMSRREAEERYGAKRIAVYTLPFEKLDRALTTGKTEGYVQIVTKKWSSKILGATIAGPRAGEMLMQIVTAMQGKIPLRKMASMIHPYPTYSLAIRKCADMWLTQTLLPLIR